MAIKYYHLAKDEELPDEFCAVRDVGGEPSDYTFYVPEAENAKLRERVDDLEELVNGKRYIPQEWYQLATTENADLRKLASKCMSALRGNGISLAEYEVLEGMCYALGVES